MRISIIGPFPPYRGGIAQFNTMLYKTLTQRAEVSALNFRRQYPAMLFPGTSQYDTDQEVDEAFSTRLLDPLSPVSWYRSARYVAGQNPDLVIYPYWMPFFAPALGSMAKRLHKLTDALTMAILHNLAPHESRPGDDALSGYLLRQTDHFMCMSGVVEADLLRLKPGANFARSPHPTAVQFGEPLDRQSARDRLGLPAGPVMLYFGLIRDYKGVMTLLDALPQVVESVGGTVIIAGEFYEDRSPYLAKIDQLEQGEHLLLADHFIPDEEVNLYFSAADVLVLPYKSATQSGNVAIARHYDLPSIVTDVGGLPEMVSDGETGLIVPPDDPPALAAAIIQFFQEALGKSMSAKMAEEKDRYSWDSFTTALLDLANGTAES